METRMTIKFSDITGGGIPYGNNAGRPANPGIGNVFEWLPAAFVGVAGVVNLSADSWYRESVVLNVEAAVRRGVRLTDGSRVGFLLQESFG